MTLTNILGYPVPTEWFYVIVPAFMILLGLVVFFWRKSRGDVRLLPSKDKAPPEGSPVRQVLAAVNPVTEEGTIQLGKLLDATIVEENGQSMIEITDPNILDAEQQPAVKKLPLKQTVPLPLMDRDGFEVMLYGIWDKGELETYSFAPLTQGGLRRWDPLMVDFSSMSFLYVGWDLFRKTGLQNLVSSTTGKFLVGVAVGLPCWLIGFIMAVAFHIRFG